MKILDWLASYSLARRVTIATVATLTVMLLLAGLTLALLFAKDQIEQSRIAAMNQASIASSTVSAAVRFGSYDVISESLRAFDNGLDPDSVAVYDRNGQLLAEFVAHGELKFPERLSGVQGRAGGMLIAKPVQLQLRDDQRGSFSPILGTLVVNPNQASLNNAFSRALTAMALVLAISACVGFWIARLLSRAMLRPVAELTGWAEAVSTSRNIGTAAPRGGGIEVDRLTTSFEALIARLTDQNRELKRRQYELEARNERLEIVAFSDALTGLPNRASFDARLTAEIAAAGVSGRRLTLLMLDMDCLAAINVQHGRARGDAAVLATASRIRRALRSTDFLARLSGAEFVIVSANIASATDAVKLAERLIVWLGISLPDDEWTEPIRASIGVTVFPDHGADAQTLTRAADKAMHRAKTLPPDESIRVISAGELATDSTVRSGAASNVYTMPKQGRKSQIGPP
jgi:diguanylate cyclase